MAYGTLIYANAPMSEALQHIYQRYFQGWQLSCFKPPKSTGGEYIVIMKYQIYEEREVLHPVKDVRRVESKEKRTVQVEE